MTLFLSLKRDAIDDGVPNPRGEINAILSIAFACLSFVLVTLRLLVRCIVSKLAGPDDYLIVGSLVVYTFFKCARAKFNRVLRYWQLAWL